MKKLKPKKIAEILGVTTQTIHYHKRKGHFKRLPGGYYDLDEVRESLILHGNKDGYAATKADKNEVALHWSVESASAAADFEKKRADILLYEQSSILRIQRELRANLTPKAIKKLSENEKLNWYRTLGADFTTKYDKERLERGKSTENVELLVKVISELRRDHVQSQSNTQTP